MLTTVWFCIDGPGLEENEDDDDLMLEENDDDDDLAFKEDEDDKDGLQLEDNEVDEEPLVVRIGLRHRAHIPRARRRPSRPPPLLGHE